MARKNGSDTVPQRPKRRSEERGLDHRTREPIKKPSGGRKRPRNNRQRIR